MAFDQEMEAALIADGEKLRALTGEDHGPWGTRTRACPKCGAFSGDDWSQCSGYAPCPMGGPWSLEADEELPPTFQPEEPFEVAELREQLTIARAALQRLSTFEAMTTEGWGFAHPELTARVDYARTALTRKEPTNV